MLENDRVCIKSIVTLYCVYSLFCLHFVQQRIIAELMLVIWIIGLFKHVHCNLNCNFQLLNVSGCRTSIIIDLELWFWGMVLKNSKLVKLGLTLVCLFLTQLSFCLHNISCHCCSHVFLSLTFSTLIMYSILLELVYVCVSGLSIILLWVE